MPVTWQATRQDAAAYVELFYAAFMQRPDATIDALNAVVDSVPVKRHTRPNDVPAAAAIATAAAAAAAA